MSGRALIVDALRSPISLKEGMLKQVRIDEVCAQVLKGLMERNPAASPGDLGDVALGCAFPEGIQGMLAARGVALLAGFPVEVPARVINRFCGSSMDALHAVSRMIELGETELAVAAGMEDMFGVPMGGYNPDFHPDLAADEYYMGMGETAELLARDLEIGRGEQEDFAVQSHCKALAAGEAGEFEREIQAIETPEGLFAADEGPREPDLEKIRSLDPAFIEGGTITAATSSPVSKGAAALLVASEEYVKRQGLKARAEVVSRGVAGVEPTRMGGGPLPATEKALGAAGLKISDMEAIELNEAFAAQSLYVIRSGKWPGERINLKGGAIALGHPLGASGARILCTLLGVLEDRGLKTGLATMCIGGGQGIATVIRRLDGGTKAAGRKMKGAAAG